MSHSTIRLIVYETCTIIWEAFCERHMPFPTEAMFESIANDFQNKWNFPNCVGCIDGKHIRIRCPSNSGSMYYNYKQYFSEVLQAVSDANYRFICVDIGAFGKQSDGGIFANSSLYAHLQNKSLNIPKDKPLPQSNLVLPHVFLGDEAYPLKTYLMKPYPKRDLQEEEEVFNYRLSRARRIVECAFGILTAKWRVLKRDMEIYPDKVEIVVKCTCILHNIIIDREGVKETNLTQVASRTGTCKLNKSRTNNRANQQAYDVRNAFKNYFNSDLGSVPFQYNRT